MSATTTWSDPERCPFCGDRLASPGVGFVTHLSEAPECESAFTAWRERIGGDMAGGWSG